MRLLYINHNYTYAVEQMTAALFPVTVDTSDSELVTKLSEGKVYTTASCRYNGQYYGFARVRNENLTDSAKQAAVKTAIYRAVRAGGMAQPPWGALSGVRPGKLMRNYMSVKKFCEEYDVTPERAELCYQTSLFTLKAEQNLGEKEICLYVGIPFCPTRCAYCSFVSQSVEKSMKLIPLFLDALKKELKAISVQTESLGLKIAAIYFGGGTPTTLTAIQLDDLCLYMESLFDMSRLREFCVEAGRPDTITAEKMTVLKRHGVSRVSVNPQTMNDSVLETIGRKHSASDIVKAISTVRSAGEFDINMDLIAGLPSDTLESFKNSVDSVLALNPENITVHTLSLKRGSSLLNGDRMLPNDAEVGAMLEYAYEKLRSGGFKPYYLYRQKNMSGGYENTGWTVDGHENLYNICMMEELCTIVAAGGGGSSKLIRRDGGKNNRIVCPKYPLEYIEQIEKICKDKAKIGEFYVQLI